MKNWTLFIPVIITGIILLYFIVRGVISLNKYGLTNVEAKKTSTHRNAKYLIGLFSLSLLVVTRELFLIYINNKTHQIALIILYTLAIISVAYILHKLFFTKVYRDILNNVLPCFELYTEKNSKAKEDFAKINKFFIDQYQLFEEPAEKLLELIDHKIRMPHVFNIKKESNNSYKFKNIELFYLYIQILKEKSIKVPLSSYVILKRFQYEKSPLVDSNKNLIKQLNNLSTNSFRAISKFKNNKSDLYSILSTMETYHISFSKNCRKSFTKDYLKDTKRKK